MPKRALFVYSNAVYLAGPTGADGMTAYDLDKAMREGAEIMGPPAPISPNGPLLLLIDEDAGKASPQGGTARSPV